MAALFISHSSRDDQATTDVLHFLRAQGFDALFVDIDPQGGIPAGRNWEQELYAQLRRADAVVFIGTPDSIASRWCAIEVSLARSIGKPVIPVLVAGTDRLTLLQDVQWVDLTDSVERGFGQLLDGLRRAGLDARDSFAWNPRRSPYPGLDSFAPEDAAVFFGRKRETAELHDRLRRTLQRGRGQFIAVVGPSGCGKSSLVGAGLLPRLSRLGDEWVVVPGFAPGEHPAAELTRSLSRVVAEQRHDPRGIDVESQLGHGSSSGLVDLALRLCNGSSGRSGGLLLFIDQAEELITRTASGERAAFLQLLRGALHADSPVWVVATLRSEFLGRFLALPGGADIFDDTYPVGPLGRNRLPEVIEGPAQRAGLVFEPGLVQRMVDDTLGGDSLPLLAFALRQLYDRAEHGRPISIADYESAGGVVGALRRQADGVLRELTTRHARPVIFATLLQMVSIEQGGEPARRPLRMSTLGPDQVDVVRALVDARLLNTYDVDDETMVEVAHEALLRLWDPLDDAINESRRALELRTEVERTARAWDDSGRDESFLPRGVRLSSAMADGKEDQRQQLSPPERDFLAAAETFAAREAAAQRRSIRRLRRVAAGLAALLVAFGVVSILALQQRRAADDQRRFAEDQRGIATARGLLAEANAVRESDPHTSMMLGIAAAVVDPNPQTRASLIQTLTESHFAGALTGFTEAVTSVAYSPQDQTLATGSYRDVTVWNVEDLRAPRLLATLPGESGLVVGLAYSPDGRLLATVTREGAVIVWDVTDYDRPRLRASLSPHRSLIGTVAADFGADGRTLAVANSLQRRTVLWRVPDRAGALTRLSAFAGPPELAHYGVALSVQGETLAVTGAREGTVDLWDISDPTSPDRLDSVEASYPVAFSPDGRTLATVESDGGILWDLGKAGEATESGRIPASIPVAFSVDGQRLAAVEGRTVTLWNVSPGADPAQVAALTGHEDRVEDAAFSPDGKWLATAGFDGAAMLWTVADPADPTRAGALRGGTTHYARRTMVALSPDGRTVVNRTSENELSLWDARRLGTRARLGAITGQDGSAGAVTFSPDGLTLAVDAVGGTTLWDVEDPAAPSRLGMLSDAHGALAFSPDGRLAAIAGAASVTLWSISDPLHPSQVSTVGGLDNDAFSIAVSPDGATLAVGSVADILIADISDPAKPAPLTTLTHRSMSGFVGAVAFSPDGLRLASGGTAGNVMLWDLSDSDDSTLLARLTDGGEAHAALAFSPDGQTLVSSGYNWPGTLWDVTDASHPFQLDLLPGLTGVVSELAFDPTGRTLLTGASDGSAILWDTTQRQRLVADPVDFACGITGRGLSPTEWQDYAPGLAYLPTCPR